MLKIYHVRGTRSVRPVWLCYELDLPFELAPIDFSTAFRNSAQWRAISPAGKVPVLQDGDLTMFESGAMIDYILERYGEGRLCPPPGTKERALCQQWSWFSEATLLRPLGINRILSGAGGEALAADGALKAGAALEVVDKAVLGRAFLLGDAFSAADVMMGYALELLAALNVLDERYPHASAYLVRLSARAAFARALSA